MRIGKLLIYNTVFILLLVFVSLISAREADVQLLSPYNKLIITIEQNLAVDEGTEKVIFSFRSRIDSNTVGSGSYQLCFGIWKGEEFFPINEDYLVTSRALIMNGWNRQERVTYYQDTIAIFYLFESPDFESNTRSSARDYYVRIGNPYLFQFDLSPILQPGDEAILQLINWNGAFDIGRDGYAVILNDLNMQYFDEEGILIREFNPVISGVISP